MTDTDIGRSAPEEPAPQESTRNKSVQEIKKEKRDRDTSVEGGMSRRGFLTFLGLGSAALAAGSSGVFPGELAAREIGKGSKVGGAKPGKVPFHPIKPTNADDLVLPKGYRYDVIRSWGDPVVGNGSSIEDQFGFNNDFTAYFPIDALRGGDDSSEGLLFVNHEYVDSRFVSGFDPASDEERTARQIRREKTQVGASVMHIRRDGNRRNGRWRFVPDEKYNRRIDANTRIEVTGPAAGSAEMRMEGKRFVIGTLANCSGGVTPWNTVLTCEENYQGYYGENSASGDDEAFQADWTPDKERSQPPEHYGWVVEIDPFDKDSVPRKHTWLGRVRHENVALSVPGSGKVVAYTGHDQNDQCIYKFVSSGTYDPNDRRANFDLLSEGMLYVADFANGRWVAMDYENNPVFREGDFKSQAEVLVRTPDAAALEDDKGRIGTPLDRCEDIEIDPANPGVFYAALTNNTAHGNFHGQIIRVYEKGGNPEAESFEYEVFAAGGPNTGFSSPDNLVFDNDENLWMVTDISSSSLNEGIYKPFKNNGAFVLPDVESAQRGELYQFASGPVECEMTGPTFTPDGRTLFLSVQHPGEESESVDDPSSRWPDGGAPKPSVVAITGFPKSPKSPKKRRS